MTKNKSKSEIETEARKFWGSLTKAYTRRYQTRMLDYIRDEAAALVLYTDDTDESMSNRQERAKMLKEAYYMFYEGIGVVGEVLAKALRMMSAEEQKAYEDACKLCVKSEYEGIRSLQKCAVALSIIAEYNAAMNNTFNAFHIMLRNKLIKED